ncbi:MAG: hypothetical protein IJP67_03250, partial [Oscillospiraceae bacterium]|nr:hypothetical protein [Oscillospiraceae bacterium]
MADYDSLFESGKPTREDIIRLYDAGRKFKTAINLYETVKVNEDFYIGKQWEGVNAGGLPTPCVNILKRDVGFVVASVTSDNLSVQVVPMEATPGTRELDE